MGLLFGATLLLFAPHPVTHNRIDGFIVGEFIIDPQLFDQLSGAGDHQSLGKGMPGLILSFDGDEIDVSSPAQLGAHLGVTAGLPAGIIETGATLPGGAAPM